MNLLVRAAGIQCGVINADNDMAEGDRAKAQPPRPATCRDFDDTLRNPSATTAEDRDHPQHQAQRGCG